MELIIKMNNIEPEEAAVICSKVSDMVEIVNNERTTRQSPFIIRMQFSCQTEEPSVPEPKEETTFSRYMKSAKN